MTARQDALAGAAEMILAIEAAAHAHPNAVGTVGEIDVRPGAKNVVPGESTFSIDLRAPADVPPVPLDPKLRDLLLRATSAVGIAAPELVSGAGHVASPADESGSSATDLR